MSTNYYKLSAPVTHLVVIDRGTPHVTLGIWVNHAKVGELTLRNDHELKDMLVMLSEYDPALGAPVLHTAFGGTEVGLEVIEHGHLEDDDQIVSERGELWSVRAIRARKGEGKSA